MKSKIIFHFFIFLFGFFVGNLFPTFFGHIVGSITSFFLLLILEGFNFIGTRGREDLPNYNKDNFGSEAGGRASQSRGLESGLGGKGYAAGPNAATNARATLTPTPPLVGLGYVYMKPLRSQREIYPKDSPYSIVLVSIFNSLKIGILFGLFVDAFKVGS